MPYAVISCDAYALQLNDIVEAIQSEFGSQADMTFRLKTIAAPFGALSVTVIATIPDPSRLTQQQSRIPAGYESD